MLYTATYQLVLALLGLHLSKRLVLEEFRTSPFRMEALLKGADYAWHCTRPKPTVATAVRYTLDRLRTKLQAKLANCSRSLQRLFVLARQANRNSCGNWGTHQIRNARKPSLVCD